MKTLTIRIAPLLIASLSLVLAIGCGTTPTDADHRTGTLQGRVMLYNMEASRLSTHAGVRVTVDGTGYQSVTNSDGTWSIPNLPAGTYDLKFSRNDCREHRIFRYEFTGEDASLHDITMTVSDLNFTFTSFRSELLPRGVRFSGSLSRPELNSRKVYIYLGTTPDVSPILGNFIFDFPASSFHRPPAGDDDVDFSYDYMYQTSRHLRDVKLIPGTRLYARAYLSSPIFTGYDDRATALKQRTNLSTIASDVISFTMP